MQNQEGIWISKFRDIKKEFVDYFTDLFSAKLDSKCTPEAFKDWVGPMRQITSAQNESLMEPFTLTEIKEAMFSMIPIKSSGPQSSSKKIGKQLEVI